VVFADEGQVLFDELDAHAARSQLLHAAPQVAKIAR
jgi:hypothetical protein